MPQKAHIPLVVGSSRIVASRLGIELAINVSPGYEVLQMLLYRIGCLTSIQKSVDMFTVFAHTGGVLFFYGRHLLEQKVWGTTYTKIDHGNGGDGGMALFRSTANGESGTNTGNGGDGGLALGPGSQANGENGHRGGLAIGAGSDANGGGLALEGGNTEGGGGFADDDSTHPGCDIAIDHDCFNQPGR